MKWFVRLFLLITFTLLGEYGVHACGPERAGKDTGSKTIHVTIHNHQFNYNCDWEIGRSSQGLTKTEYRRIRGTNEEDDDDENTFVVKKVKPLKSITSKYDFTNFALSLSQQSIEADRYILKIRSPFSFPFLSSNKGKLYSLFEVFRI